MAYRKSSPSEIIDWIRQNARTLELFELPEVIVADPTRCRPSIEEGEDPRSGWNYRWIRPQDAAPLCARLRQVPEFRDSYLVQFLEDRDDANT